MTAEEFVEKVKSASAHLDWQKGESAVEAACWFIAVQRARMHLEDMRVKDLANLIVQGRPVDGPYLTMNDIREWIRDEEDAAEDAAWAQLDADLKAHFGGQR